jgi:flagellar protein FlaG
MQDMFTQPVQPATLVPVQQRRNSNREMRAVAVSASGATQAGAQETRQSGISADQLGKIVERINQELQGANRELRFNIDDQSGRIVVKVVNTETDEVIRQIPSEEVLALARSAKSGDGMIFNVRA